MNDQEHDSMARQKPGILRRVWPTSPVDPDTFNINLVIVPAVGAPAVDRFLKSNWAWLIELARYSEVHPRIFLFDYATEKTDGSIWQSIVFRGSELTDLLVRDTDALARPLVFVSHGLGGVIVKQALRLADQQGYNPSLRRFLEVHSGTIFLSSPHPKYARRNDDRIPLSHLLRCYISLSKAILDQAGAEEAIIQTVCRKYQEAAIEVPVISTFETKPTKVSMGLFRSWKGILVTRSFAEIALKYEQLFATQKSHTEANVVDAGSDLSEEIFKLLCAVVANRQNIHVPSRPQPQPVQVDNFTWASTAPDPEDRPDQIVSTPSDSKHLSSNQAVFGSTEASSFVFVQGVNDITQSQAVAQVPCLVLGPEPQNPDFFGRGQILDMISNSLNPMAGDTEGGSPVTRSFSLCGLAGVGKSQIATEFVHRHIASYDAIFWVQADNDNSIADSFIRIATELRLLSGNEKKDAVISRNLVMEWLSNPVKSRPEREEEGDVTTEMATWLIVYDNADDLDLLSDYWPTTTSGNILVTSRDPLAKSSSSLPGVEGIDLETLDPEESSALLMKVAGFEASQKNKEQSAALGKRLGGLPLALAQIAAVVRRRHMTFQEFLDVFNEEPSNREILLGQEKYQHTLSTIWHLDSLSSQARSLLSVLSLLDPDAVYESLFDHDLSQARDRTFPSTKLDYLDARGSLLKSSLVKRTEDEQQLLIHRLVQDATRAHLSTDQLEQAFGTSIDILSKSWPKSSFLFSHETSIWNASDKIVPHIIKMARIYEQDPERQFPLETLRQLAGLLQKGGWHVCEKGNFKVAESMFACSLKICEQHAQDIPEEYADALFCSGSIASDTNRFKLHMELAKRHFKQRMEVENKKPKLTLGAGLAHSEMALAHLLNNQYEQTIEYPMKAREINQESTEFLSGKYWPFFAIIHHAQALIGLNRHEEAEGMLLETLRWRQVQFGANDTESFKTGYALQVLGTIRQKQDRHAEAFDMFNRALDNYKATVGLSHHRTGHILVKLGDENIYLGQFSTAMSLYNQALQIFESNPSAYVQETARTAFKKALLYELLGNMTEAARLSSRARALYSETVSEYVSYDTTLTLSDYDSIVSIWAR